MWLFCCSKHKIRTVEWPREAENQIHGIRRFLAKKRNFFNKKLDNSSVSAGIALKRCGIDSPELFTSKLYSNFFLTFFQNEKNLDKNIKKNEILELFQKKSKNPSWEKFFLRVQLLRKKIFQEGFFEFF